MPVTGLDAGMIAQLALQQPGMFAKIAAAKGMAPPTTPMGPAMPGQALNASAPMMGGNAQGGAMTDMDWGKLVNPQAAAVAQSPLAGLSAPSTTPAAMPFPGSPGLPRPSQPITPAATLAELLMKANQQGGAAPMQGGVPNLAALLGR